MDDHASSEFDWFGFEDALVGELRAVARALVYQVDGELPFAFALTGGYHDSGGPIDFPVPVLGTVESVSPQHIRAPERWPHRDEHWADRPPLDGWHDRLNAAVDALAPGPWNLAYSRYTQALHAAMKRARAELIAEGAFPSRIAVLVEGRPL